MGKIWIPGGGGGSDLDVITAAAGDVVSGKVIVDKDGEPLTGTLSLSGNADAVDVLTGKTFYNTDPKNQVTGSMVNQGAWNGSCGTNGSVTIPAGYHNGSGKVTNSQAKMGGGTYTAGAAAQTVSCNGKLMTGNIVINPASSIGNCSAGNIRNGVKIGNVTGSCKEWQVITLNGQNTAGGRNFSDSGGGGWYCQYLKVTCAFTPVVVSVLHGTEASRYTLTQYGMMRVAGMSAYFKIFASGGVLYIPVPASGAYYGSIAGWR